MVAVTTVRKISRHPDEDYISEVHDFPWRSRCMMCPWKFSAGYWRDAYDFAFYHAAEGAHIGEEPDLQATAIPTELLYPPGAGYGSETSGEDNPASDHHSHDSDAIDDGTSGGSVRIGKVVMVAMTPEEFQEFTIRNNVRREGM